MRRDGIKFVALEPSSSVDGSIGRVALAPEPKGKDIFMAWLALRSAEAWSSRREGENITLLYLISNKTKGCFTEQMSFD